MSDRKVIAVFGSSGPAAGTPDYQAAYQAGRLLASKGYAVMTGGYGGVMAAASQGAAEAGGHVIGTTSARIESFRDETPNRWITEEVRYPNLSDRLYHIVRQTDGAIAMPGGIGTLAEIALSWNLMQVKELAPKPLVLVGPLWQVTFETMIEHADGYVASENRNLLQFAATPAEAVDLIDARFRPG